MASNEDGSPSPVGSESPVNNPFGRRGSLFQARSNSNLVAIGSGSSREGPSSVDTHPPVPMAEGASPPRARVAPLDNLHDLENEVPDIDVLRQPRSRRNEVTSSSSTSRNSFQGQPSQHEIPVNHSLSNSFPLNQSTSPATNQRSILNPLPFNQSSRSNLVKNSSNSVLVASTSSSPSAGSPHSASPSTSAPGSTLNLSGNPNLNPVVQVEPMQGPMGPAIGFHSGELMFNWQASKPSLKDRMNAVFNKETLADVHFILGQGDRRMRLPAHKFVLSIGSAVFDAMFNGKMANTEEDIELPDIEPAAFQALLKFLYTDEISIGPETVMTTLYSAKKYSVPALEKICVDFLTQNLNWENAFMLLSQARLFDENILAQTCLSCIDETTVDATSAEGFLDIDHETLSAVLKRDTLRIREVALFNSVLRWAEAMCIRKSLAPTPHNQRAVLSTALYLIRFPLMTIEEFAQEVAQSQILSDREVVNMFLWFTVNPKPAVEFPIQPRSSITGKEHVLQRFSKTESRWGYSGTSDRIRFVVDRRIFLVGFGLYGSIHGPSSYDVNIQVIQSQSGKVIASNETSFACDGTSHTFRVTFKAPVEILPNTGYTACATLKGTDSHYGTAGNRNVVVDLQGGKKVTFTFQYAAGCNNGTSVEDGQIPEFIFYT